jgi:hypothetical protein
MKQKLASIAFPAPDRKDIDRLVTYALDAHVGKYKLDGWEVNFALLDDLALKTMREMVAQGDHRGAADLSLYCGCILAEEWLFGRGYRVRARKLEDPVLGEAYLFTWQ